MTEHKPAVTVTPRKVLRANSGYIVVAQVPAEMANQSTTKWVPTSKYYKHSTSAFAALGRQLQKDILEQQAK